MIPGVVSVLLFLLFTYLYEQSRQAYFRAWQLAWAGYSLHYVLDAFRFSARPRRRVLRQLPFWSRWRCASSFRRA